MSIVSSKCYGRDHVKDLSHRNQLKLRRKKTLEGATLKESQDPIKEQK